MKNQPDYEKIKREYKPNKIFSGTKGIFAVAIICFFGFWVVLFVGLSFSNPYRFSLPYNAIDFQKIAYIDNQFVMYGIDYDKSGLKQLAIFNSTDGKTWTKSEIKITDDFYQWPVSFSGTFNYFNGKCYLIGATVQPLVAGDCKHWQTQPINRLENKEGYLYKAHSSAIANNTLYVGGEKGVYKTINGNTWTKELLPYPEESNPNNFENSFYSMAVGNNKLVTETNWWQNKQRHGLIYTKDLTTDKWSYEVYPIPVTNITRGKDRFVAMTESRAILLVDGDHRWSSNALPYYTNLLAYGYHHQFLGVSGYLYVLSSLDGNRWEAFNQPQDYSQERKSINSVYCKNDQCIGVGYNYYIVKMESIGFWSINEFNHKNPKPHWWRRFF